MSELFAGQEVQVSGADVSVAHLACDSRRVEADGLFAALPGAQVDGHDFVDRALAAGAKAVLCERPIDTGDATRIVAADARFAFARAARAFFGDPAGRLTMVGVTGTNGKTTVVHLLAGVLRAAGRAVGVIGTLGSEFVGADGARRVGGPELTTPESVDLVALLAEMADAGVGAVAMEVSSHALAQHRVAGVSFDAGLFLNLSHEHLDFHGTLAAYFAAKRRLLEERLKAGGRAVINLDDAQVASLAEALPGAIGFSSDPARLEATVRPEVVTTSRDGIAMTLRLGERDGVELRSPLLGAFNVENIVAAAAVGHALDLDPSAIAAGIASVTAVPGRLEPVGRAPLVLVDYSHTPAALELALTAVRRLISGRLLCVVGCGGDRDVDKRPLMGEVAGRLADRVVVTNDNPRSEDPAAIAAAVAAGLDIAPPLEGYQVQLDRAAAIRLAVGNATPEDAVLIAGKGHETYQIIGSVRRDFDDREVARAALAERGAGA